MEQNAVLVLEDGTVLRGAGFGAKCYREGEVVFNTSMGGYQEALTDPSYKYQIMMMTYPLMGNYGINTQDFESDKIHAEGFIVRELCEKPGHSKSEKTLARFLEENNIPGIQGIDTRQLTKKIRVHGSMNGILKYPYQEDDIESLKKKAQNLKSISDFDLVSLVTTPEVKRYDIGGKKTVALIDCGAKRGIVRCLNKRGINVVQVPANTKADDILSYEPDGIMVSNGPGDPERADYAIKAIQEIMREKIPLFGICLGLQLLSIASGATTYKLKFGHRGANQPVKDLSSGRVHITSQNHGFAVDNESAAACNLEVTHINLNDGSVEGVRHKEYPAWAVQYHPEANPGPRYNYYLFDEFINMLK